MVARIMSVLSRQPRSGEAEMDMDKLYRQYQDTCIDRGVFTKSRNELDANDKADWLLYVTALVAALPSQAERQATLEGGPGRSPV